jgi:2-polyprenyl-6-methoxyphenol hydroxylase-like FAD-dependent oxidoreductase
MQLRAAPTRAPALRRPPCRSARVRCAVPARATAQQQQSGLVGDTAVVIGASLAGLLSAAALAPHFGRVVVLDRDAVLPGLAGSAAAPRKGVPQSSQPHVLFARGLRELEAALPGVTADLLAEGALPVDWSSEFRVFVGDSWAAQSGTVAGGAHDDDVASLTCSRYVLESAARRRLAAVGARNVSFRPGARVAALLRSGDAVGGVALDSGEALPAALTVDAAGRGSGCASWLAAAGFAPELAAPSAATVDGGLRYATRVFRLPSGTDDVAWKVLLLSHEAPHRRRLGYAAKLEGRRLVATLGGYERDAPPLDDVAWRAFAATLPGDGAFLKALEGAVAEPGYEAAQAQAATANVRRAFAPLPGLCHVGDSAMALCPAYGQGMTQAALAACQLRNAAKQAADDVASGRLDAPSALAALSVAMGSQSPEAKSAWALAAGQDAAFPAAVVAGVELPRASAMLPPLAWYAKALRRRAAVDPKAWKAMLRVAHSVAPPQTLISPKLAASVLAAEARDAWRQAWAPKKAAAAASSSSERL